MVDYEGKTTTNYKIPNSSAKLIIEMEKAELNDFHEADAKSRDFSNMMLHKKGPLMRLKRWD